MVSEEIGIREYLMDNNEVWETDLGELIIQVAEDKPVHMIIPAIHYSEKHVREILAKIGVTGNNAEELAREVRKFMRSKFLMADAGISGCNAFSMHVVFIDNGRSSARFVEQLACVKCGRCQLECPVFQVMGNLWGGRVYGGPMGVDGMMLLVTLRISFFPVCAGNASMFALLD